MIAALRQFDDITAAGILARAALALDHNPASDYHSVPNEVALREIVIAEAARAHGVAFDFSSPESLEKITDALDEERDALLAPRDPLSALERLSERGTLPSDLFEIDIIRNISEFHREKFPREERLIRETVRSPDKEQHFGPPSEPGQPFLISLFGKYFPHQYPLKGFMLLVAGQRKGLRLEVHQAWRLYPDFVSGDSKSLVDLLQRFSDVFRVEIELEGKRGHFILTADLPNKPGVTARWSAVAGEAIRKRNLERREITLTCFTQPHPVTQVPQAALAVAIDLNKYRRFLESRDY